MTGYTTIHAGSARQALTRLRFISQLAETSSELSLAALNSLVSEAIDIVVHCTRSDGRTRVNEIVAVEDLQGGLDAANFTTTTIFVRDSPDHALRWTGNLPSRAARALTGVGYDVRELGESRQRDAQEDAPPSVDHRTKTQTARK